MILAQFFAAVQIKIFLKISDFIFGQKWPILGQKQPFWTILTFKDLRYHKKDIEVDDTTGTSTVCRCRSDANIFENLGFHFWSKMAHFRSKIAIFGLFSLLKTSDTIKNTQKWMILRVLAQFVTDVLENLGFHFWPKMAYFC